MCNSHNISIISGNCLLYTSIKKKTQDTQKLKTTVIRGENHQI